MPRYEIAIDEARRTLRATLHGFWDMATVENYLTDLTAAGARVARGGAPNWWLIDLQDSQVQSRDVATRMGETLPALFSPATTLAIVSDASLPTVQAKRIVPNEQHRHFTTTVEAERWLTEQGRPA